MGKSWGSDGCFPEGFCEDCIDEVEISAMFESRWIAAANNSVKFLVNFGLRFDQSHSLLLVQCAPRNAITDNIINWII